MADQAKQFKDKGNAFFQAKQFNEAIEQYTKAIQLYDKDHTFFSNRSASYAGIKSWEKSLNDADKCISLKADFSKVCRLSFCFQNYDVTL